MQMLQGVGELPTATGVHQCMNYHSLFMIADRERRICIFVWVDDIIDA